MPHCRTAELFPTALWRGADRTDPSNRWDDETRSLIREFGKQERDCWALVPLVARFVRLAFKCHPKLQGPKVAVVKFYMKDAVDVGDVRLDIPKTCTFLSQHLVSASKMAPPNRCQDPDYAVSADQRLRCFFLVLHVRFAEF